MSENQRGNYTTEGLHSPNCKLKREKRDKEPEIRTQCGQKVLRCWIDTHWDLCFEMKGACFFPKPKV